MKERQAFARLALPSKGELEEETLAFMANCGLAVAKTNPRQYSATVPALQGLEVVFQRAADIVAKVNEGTVQLGITGYDLVEEHRDASDNILVLLPDLGFGQCELAVAVPETWLDISTLGDLVSLGMRRHAQAERLRIVTKFPNLTREFFYQKGMPYFTIVEAQGAVESGPSMGYADVVVDLVSTGTTLRDNQLKRIQNTAILKSQACLVGNKQSLNNEGVLAMAKALLELFEAHLRAHDHLFLTATLQAPTLEEAKRLLMLQMGARLLQRLSITPLYSHNLGTEQRFSVQMVVEKSQVMRVVDQLRKATGESIAFSTPNYVFRAQSVHFKALLEKLKRR